VLRKQRGEKTKKENITVGPLLEQIEAQSDATTQQPVRENKRRFLLARGGRRGNGKCLRWASSQWQLVTTQMNGRVEREKSVGKDTEKGSGGTRSKMVAKLNTWREAEASSLIQASKPESFPPKRKREKWEKRELLTSDCKRGFAWAFQPRGVRLIGGCLKSPLSPGRNNSRQNGGKRRPAKGCAACTLVQRSSASGKFPKYCAWVVGEKDFSPGE